jgi:hypothetical protein
MLCAVGKCQSSRAADECKQCEIGQSSMRGSPNCTICDLGYYRPQQTSSASKCSACDAKKMRRGFDTTIATLNLTRGYWRHSALTIDMHGCKEDRVWTPCRGGANASSTGEGYCAEGYRGPRCELCAGQTYSKHFDKLSASCKDCGDVTARTTVVASALLVVLLAAFGLIATFHRLEGSGRCGGVHPSSGSVAPRPCGKRQGCGTRSRRW